MKRLVIVSPSYHCDVVWRRPPSEQVAIRQKQYDAALDMLDKRADFCFEFDQATLVREYLDANPHRLESMRRFVAEGRLEITGGEETISDTNLVGGEGIVRNLLLGRLWFAETLGAVPTVASFDDAFGQSWQLPQIFSGFGYECYRDTRTPRLDPQVNARGIVWEGLDGSRVFYLPAHGALTEFTHICNLPIVYGPVQRLRASLEEACARDVPVVFVRYCSEEDFVEDRIIETVQSFVPPTGVELRFGLCGEIMRLARAANPKPRTITGELNPTLQGTHITRIGLKQAYRQAEWATRVAETASTCAALAGAKYPARAFLELWRKLSYVQFHDAICGCHTDDVNRKVMGYARQVKQSAGRLAARAGEVAPQAPTAHGQPQAITLFNPLPFARREPVALDLPEGMLVEGTPAQRTAAGTVVVAAMAPLGATTLRLVKGAATKAKALPLRKALGQPVRVGRYEITAEDHGATVRHLGLKRTLMRGALPEVGFRHEDGDLWLERYLGPVYGEDAGERKLTQVEEGPVFTRFVWQGLIRGDPQANPMPPVWAQQRDGKQVVYADLKRLAWEKELLFYHDFDRIDVKVNLDFHGINTEVSLLFPLEIDLHTSRALYDIPFGAVERKPYYEVPCDSPEAKDAPVELRQYGGTGHYPAVDWVAYEDENWGMVLANEGTPAHRLMGGKIEVLVLRSPTKIDSDFTPPKGAHDNGKHAFRFALEPYAGDVFASGAYQLGQRCNAAPLSIIGAEAAGAVLAVQAEGIVMSCFKPAERGEGMIIRTYETAGRKVTGSLVTGLPWHEVWETDLMEQPRKRARLDRLSWRPYEIKTLLVR